VRILLDTQCLLWMAGEPERLSVRARQLVDDRGHELLLSTASAWEIAFKYGLGKLRLPEPPAQFVPSRLQTLGVRPLAIELTHALHVATLPPHHRDPFDRLIIAQAQLEDIPILTGDPLIFAYDVTAIAAT
jgi:PIN domain nuclease of toxin-antitoxin system